MEENLSHKPHNTSAKSSLTDKLFRMRKILALAVLLVVGIGTIVTIQQVQRQQDVRQQAAYPNGADLTVSASDTTPNVGDTITLTLGIVSNTIPMTAIEGHINLPTDTFQILNFDATGSTFSGSFKYGPVQRGNDYNFIRTNDPETPSIGSGKIAVITAKVLRAGAFTINYLPLTQVTGHNLPGENIINQMYGANLTITGTVNTPTPSPTTSPKADLGLTSADTSYQVGEQFTVDATIDTNGLTATAAKLNIQFNGNDVEIVKDAQNKPLIVGGPLLPVTVIDPTSGYNNGTISVGSTTGSPPNGTGVIAKITFKARRAVSTTQIKYATTGNEVTVMQSSGNALGITTPLNLVLTAAPGVTTPPTATPTVTPTRTPTPTVTPTRTPTPTLIQVTPPAVGAAQVRLSIKLRSIGRSAGDNVSPTSDTRNVKVDILTPANSVVTSVNGTIAYNQVDGKFVGTISVPGITAGPYYAVIKVKGNMNQKIQVQLVPSSTLTMSTINPLPGDINDDGKLDIFDYNILITCFGNRAASTLCGSRKAAANINDDVDPVTNAILIDSQDYNTLLTGFRDLP